MYQIQPLLKYKNLFHAFSTVSDGNMANVILDKTGNIEQVLANRINFLKNAGVPIDKTICMWVTGSDDFSIAQLKDAGASILDFNKAVKTDGLVTDEKGLYLFLVVADCAPIILFDRKKEVLALIHSGWKGTDLEIVKKVGGFLQTKYKSEMSDIVCGIGPMASKDSYIQTDPGQKNDPKWKSFVVPLSKDVYKVDVLGLIKKQLEGIGIKQENIFESEIDTIKDENYYSHYRQKNLAFEKQGRFACVIGLI